MFAAPLNEFVMIRKTLSHGVVEGLLQLERLKLCGNQRGNHQASRFSRCPAVTRNDLLDRLRPLRHRGLRRRQVAFQEQHLALEPRLRILVRRIHQLATGVEDRRDVLLCVLQTE